MKNFYISITKKEALSFSKITKDKNPIHLDSKIGLSSIYRKNISHGVLLVLKCLFEIKSKVTFSLNDYSIIIKFLKPIFFDSRILIKSKFNFLSCNIDLFQNNQKICSIILRDKDNLKNKNIKIKRSKNTYSLKSKKSLVFKFENELLELQDLLCSISLYVGMINPGKKGILNSIKINRLERIKNNDTRILINTKKIDKRFELYNNELSYKKFKVTFISSVRSEYKVIKYKNNNQVKKIINRIDRDILIIAGSSALGESLLNVIKENRNIKIVSTYSSKKPKKSIFKNIFYKKISLPADLLKIKKIIKKLNKPYVFYFPSPPIYFNKKLSNKIKDLYKKMFVLIPIKILKDTSQNLSTFIYPSTTNIDYDINSIYSKIKIEAEKKLKKFNNCYVYRFNKLYSRNTISMQSPNVINLQKLLNKNPNLLYNFFK